MRSPSRAIPPLMNDLVLIGASGVCHEIIDTVFEVNEQNRTWNSIHIIDDDRNKWHQTFYNDVPIVGGREQVERYDPLQTEFLITFSSPTSYLKRQPYVDSLLKEYPTIRFAKIIHPRSSISPSASIGAGTFVGLGAVVDAKASVGSHCLILFHSIVSRFVEIGDFTFISATVNITGGKSIGKSAYLGVKSTVNANIGDNVLVSAGSLVMKDVRENCIVFNEGKQEVISFKAPQELQAALEAT